LVITQSDAKIVLFRLKIMEIKIALIKLGLYSGLGQQRHCKKQKAVVYFFIAE
jgi:hypothetical protein